MQVLSVALRLSRWSRRAQASCWPPGSCRTLPAESSKPQPAAAVVLGGCSRPRSVFPGSGCWPPAAPATWAGCGLVGAPGKLVPHTPHVPCPPFPGKCLHSRHSLSPHGFSRLCIFNIAEQGPGRQRGSCWAAAALPAIFRAACVPGKEPGLRAPPTPGVPRRPQNRPFWRCSLASNHGPRAWTAGGQPLGSLSYHSSCQQGLSLSVPQRPDWIASRSPEQSPGPQESGLIVAVFSCRAVSMV